MLSMATTTHRRTTARAAHLGPERRRPKVLDGALEIAVSEGIAAISIGSVAAKLGVTRPVVYACYADRVELIRALLDREAAALTADALDALPSRRPNATEADFVDGFQALLQVASTRLDAWRLLLDSDPDPAVAEHFGRARRTMAGVIEKRLRPTFTDWDMADLDHKVPVLIEFFISACEGAVRSLLHESAWTPAELGDLIGPAVYRALRQA